MMWVAQKDEPREEQKKKSKKNKKRKWIVIKEEFLEESNQEKVAYIEIFGNDMGGGTTWCGNCHEVLNSSASKLMREKPIPSHCPKCGRKLLPGSLSEYSFGGSDF